MDSLWGALKDWIIPVGGIALTVAFGWTPLRKAIGANTERRSRANEELCDLLLRRLILEGFWPQPPQISQLRSGIATKYSLDPATLISNEALSSSILFRVLANDYLDPKRREEIFRTVENSRPNESGSVSTAVERVALVRHDDGDELRTSLLSNLGALIAGITASLAVGSIVEFVSGSKSVLDFLAESFSSIVLPVAVGGTLASALLTYWLYLRTRQRREALDMVSDKTQLEASGQSALEWQVRSFLSRARANSLIDKYEEGGSNDQFDFIVSKAGRRIIVETKSRAPRNVGDWIYQVKKLVEKTGADQGVIVIPDEMNLPRTLKLESSKVVLMSISAFKGYISESKAA